MRQQDSLKKTIILGKIEDSRKKRKIKYKMSWLPKGSHRHDFTRAEQGCWEDILEIVHSCSGHQSGVTWQHVTRTSTLCQMLLKDPLKSPQFQSYIFFSMLPLQSFSLVSCQTWKSLLLIITVLFSFLMQGLLNTLFILNFIFSLLHQERFQKVTIFLTYSWRLQARKINTLLVSVLQSNYFIVRVVLVLNSKQRLCQGKISAYLISWPVSACEKLAFSVRFQA